MRDGLAVPSICCWRRTGLQHAERGLAAEKSCFTSPFPGQHKPKKSGIDFIYLFLSCSDEIQGGRDTTRLREHQK